MKIYRIRNRRNSLATNSSSTHSVVYKNKDQVFADLGIFDNNYYGRFTETIAASRNAKIRYIFANIFSNDKLVELLSVRYPEMKEYYPLVKNHVDIYMNKERRNEISKHLDKKDYWDLWDELEEYRFGEHCRGALYNTKDIHLSYEYLCNIIDSPDIVIVGGSDECDFVYDKTEGCEKISSRFSYMNKITEKVKNGNYYVLYGETFNRKEKVRIQVDSVPDMIPEYPELVDMKITDACKHKCPFCYMASTPNGKHANISDIFKIINSFAIKTEFALGGGNVLLHPDFNKIVQHISKQNHIANITIRYDDTKTINENESLKCAIKKYVSGIGLSVQKSDDVDMANEFISEMLGLGKHIALHIIPEMIGIEESVAILNKMSEINDSVCNENKNNQSWEYNSCKVLFLGLKQSGRAKNIEHKLLTKDELCVMMEAAKYQYNVDTSFINTYDNWFNTQYDNPEYFLTRHEGEYSMFIDAVTCNAFTSSYKDDGAIDIRHYDVRYKCEDIRPINEVFAEIRRKNGFKVFEKPEPYYKK